MSTLRERWAGVRLAHEAAMLEDAQQTLKTAREVVRKHSDLPAATEDEVIHVGDIYQTTTTTAPGAKVATVATKGLGTFGKLAAAAALVASGAGVGALVPLAIDAMRPDPAAVVDTDTDTQFELRLLPTEE